MITITHDQARESTTAYAYDVLLDGEIVAAAKSWHAGDAAGTEIQGRYELLRMIEREVWHARIAHEMEIEGMRLVAPEPCKMNVLGTRWTVCGAPSDGPCYCDVHVAATAPEFDLCYVCGAAAWNRNNQGSLCPSHFAVWSEWQESVTRIDHAADTFKGNICQGCGRTSLTYYCDDCDNDAWNQLHDPDNLILTIDPRPLLRQCADLIDMLLGGPVVGGGILDEMRRVRSELANEGW